MEQYKELTPWERLVIDSWLADEQESIRLQAVRLAFKHGDSLTSISLKTGYSEGVLMDVILSTNDKRREPDAT